VITDGFARQVTKDPKTAKVTHRQHLGVDIMFRHARRRQPSLPLQTEWFHCDADVPMLAALAGKVWYAKMTGRGMTVQIDHGSRYGFPLVTYYTHMSALLVKTGQDVIAGEPIGIIGNDPSTKYDPNHCHFELWDFSRGALPREQRCIDPAPYLKTWQQLALKRVSGRYVGA
jgi:hypothetical protein